MVMLPTATSSMQYIGSLHPDIVAPGSARTVSLTNSPKNYCVYLKKKIVGVFNRTIIRVIWPEIFSLRCMVDADAKKVSAVRHHAHSLFFDKAFSCLPATACKNGNACQGYGRQAKTTSVITATLSLLYDVYAATCRQKLECLSCRQQSSAVSPMQCIGLHAVRCQITKSNSLIVSSPAKAGNLKYVRYWRLYSNAVWTGLS